MTRARRKDKVVRASKVVRVVRVVVRVDRIVSVVKVRVIEAVGSRRVDRVWWEHARGFSAQGKSESLRDRHSYL